MNIQNSNLTLTQSTNYNCIVYFNDNTFIKLYSNELRNKNLDHFNNWACAAGHLQINIDYDDNVYTCNNKNQFLGKLSEFKLCSSDHPNICRQQTCSGTTDNLLMYKHKI